MSLTSYRAAPPRDGSLMGMFRVFCYRLESMLLFRFGGDLLSHVLRRSTIGATALNCRVREGIGCFARAIATKPKKKHGSVAFANPTQKTSGCSKFSLLFICVAFDKAALSGVCFADCPGADTF